MRFNLRWMKGNLYSRLSVSLVGGRWLWVSLICLLGLGCSQSTTSEQNLALQRLHPRACQGYGLPKSRVKCYDYSTRGNGLGFQLPVVVIHSEQPGEHGLPLLYLDGGPGVTGVTSRDSLLWWMQWQDASHLKSDLILFDVRGAMPGKPGWSCQTYEEASKNALQAPITLKQEHERVAPILSRCIEEYDRRLQRLLPRGKGRFPGAGLAQLSTRQSVEDILGIVEGLGIQRFNVLASSYGTRVAMTLASVSNKPQALLLDSPYPPGKGLKLDALEVWDTAFSHFFVDVKDQMTEAQFWAAVDKLNRKPIQVTVQSWYSSTSVSWLLTGERLVYVVYQALYTQAFAKQLPDLVSDILAGRKLHAVPLLEAFYNTVFDPNFNSMIYYVTECNDNAGVSSQEALALAPAYEKWAAYFEFDVVFNICQHPLFINKSPLQSVMWHQPTLVVAGARDPITNLSYAKATVELGDHVQLWQLSGFGHAEYIHSDCGIESIAAFFEQPTAFDNRAMCVQR